MSQPDSSYLTLAKKSESLYKEKGSKFIGYAVPCYSEEEAKELLQEWREQHPQSRHLCYAYRLGVKKDVYRANDDGEPSNSAGAPILGQIKSYELTNVLIGVIRYFGGTKLGVGGLITAYKTAAKEAIELNSIVTQEIFEWVKVEFTYAVMPEVMNFLKRNNLEMIEHQFEMECWLRTKFPLDYSTTLIEELSAMRDVEVKSIGIY